MLANSGAYAELISSYPVAGGEFVFAQRLFGNRTAFLVGWLYTLSLLAVVAFEATALPWILETLMPSIKGPTLYVSLDSPVTADALLIGLSGTVIVAVMNHFGARTAATLQTVLSFAFILLALLLIGFGFALGSPENLRPLVLGVHGKPWWLGSLWIFGTAPLFLNGFQSVAQMVEERTAKVTFPRIATSMALALLISVLFYCLVTLAAAEASPWRSLMGMPLATAAAFGDLLPHRVLSTLVLIVAAMSVGRLWNGISLWTTKLLSAQGRAGFLPGIFAVTNKRYGSATFGVIFVAVCTTVGVALGRGAIIPLVDMASLCLAANLVLTCVAALRARATGRGAPYRTPGGRVTLLYALVGSAGMASFIVIDPQLRRPGHVPIEWMVIGTWVAIGALFWNIWRPLNRANLSKPQVLLP